MSLCLTRSWREPSLDEKLSGAGECVDHRAHIVSEGIKDGAGAACFDILLHFSPALLRTPGSGNELDDVVGNHSHRLSNLVLLGRPGEDAADLVQQILTHPARLHDVRLLAEVLGHQLP